MRVRRLMRSIRNGSKSSSEKQQQKKQQQDDAYNAQHVSHHHLYVCIDAGKGQTALHINIHGTAAFYDDRVYQHSLLWRSWLSCLIEYEQSQVEAELRRRQADTVITGRWQMKRQMVAGVNAYTYGLLLHYAAWQSSLVVVVS